jgi:hypothetical protein
MDKTLFETRAISIFNDRKYVFYDELQQGGTLKQMTNSHYAALLAVGALVGFGAYMINRSNFIDSEVKAELVKLGALCELIGIHVSTGLVCLVLFVYGDELTDEAAIGKSHLIRDGLIPFEKYTMRIGWNKMPVIANVFYVFGNSETAFRFRQSVQSNCKHYTLFSKARVLPWGVDLSAKSVWAHKGWPPPQFKPADIEANLFSGQI